jgi:hypothetical protein
MANSAATKKPLKKTSKKVINILKAIARVQKSQYKITLFIGRPVKYNKQFMQIKIG